MRRAHARRTGTEHRHRLAAVRAAARRRDAGADRCTEVYVLEFIGQHVDIQIKVPFRAQKIIILQLTVTVFSSTLTIILGLVVKEINKKPVILRSSDSQGTGRNIHGVGITVLPVATYSDISLPGCDILS